jgi:dephospho-CoA kinase
MVIGLAGGYCAGKETVARIFETKGYTVVDVDRVGHQVLGEKAPEVISAFGSGVVGAGGSVDRRALSRIVFANHGELKRLERIVHPAMVEKVESIVRSAKGNVLINAAILFTMGLAPLCDAVICVSSPGILRAFRGARRDGVTVREAFQRILSQGGIYSQCHGSAVDIYNVRNWGNFRSLERSVGAVLERLERGKAL